MKKQLLLLILALFGTATFTYSQMTCGSTFTDPAGATANYADNSDYTVTIYPTNPGDKVTVTFTSFATEVGFDALYVFDGNAITAPQIASSNPAQSVPGGLAGGFWGTTIPGPFTSTSIDGALTFRFRSDGSINKSGWTADVTCGVAPSCSAPTMLASSAVTTNSITISWTQPSNPDTSVATSWECLVVPVGSPAPTATTTGGTSTSVNPFIISGLTPNTCYTFYVRAVCAAAETSAWSTGNNFCTLILPPVCGGQFVDSGGASGNYGINENTITTICPTNAGEVVTVSFSSFTTEASFDTLYVFDGNSIASPQISSTNAAPNIAGGLAGGYWGNIIPGPFTSTSADGCLTFRFRSDGSIVSSGWVANVSCAPPPTCIRPSSVATTAITTNSFSLGWAENSGATSWEVITLPCGQVPSASSIGTITSSNPYTVTGLNPGTCYASFVRSICSSTDVSLWSSNSTVNTSFTPPINDECINAIVVPVNHSSCFQITPGTLNGATASTPALSTTCTGTADDDVWFTFVATNTKIVSSISGTATAINQALYSGTCGNLTLVNCSNAQQGGASMATNLNVGETYYLRVFSNVNTPQTVSFNLCVSSQPSCEEGQSICGVNNYVNTTGSPSLGTIGCLATTPNPTYFSIKISASGSVNMLLTQTGIGSTTPNLDVDYVAWGPFASQSAACTAISGGATNLTGLTTGCSYSAAPSEHFNLANAIAGEYYIILITNFSNQTGFINVVVDPSSTGSIDCSGIRLNAFLDTNGNGTQESGEQNFPLGQFHYVANNDNNVHNITSPSGTYTLYDDNLTNSYNLSYSINSDYNLMYSNTTSFTNVVVASGSMTTYNFPITSLQNYTDLGVTIAPLSSPRAGTTYKVKIVYTNNGNQTLASGTVTFNNNAGTSITNISQTGTTAITNGFTYAFTDLLPYESRTIIVTISVPAIPNVSLGQLLTNTVSILPPTGDIVANNDSNSVTQAVVGSYDPNDKVEGHGNKILFSSFTANDYLEYTIRFENNGTAGALNVMVNDILDTKLDESTLVMLASSHNYTLDRLGNTLTWKFNNIQLPVSIPDTDIGKGFIKFKIKPKAGYAVGDIIPNTAEIFFDFNPAIVTNTFNTEFVAVLGNDLFTENSIILYPNPATSLVQITLQNTAEIIENIAIYDILGKKVSLISNVASNQSTIDVSTLSTGVYLVEIATENNLKQIKKLIIQ